MRVEKFDYNSFDELLANTYVVFDDDKNAVIIDPSKDYEGIVNYLKKNELNPIAILLTHGHFDHFGGVNVLLENYPNLKVYIEGHDYELLGDPTKNCSYMCGESLIIDIDPIFVKDGTVLKLLKDEEIVAINTTFHTMGSSCYYFKNNNWLFSGDTLFAGGIGRYDLPTSCPKLIQQSLGKLKSLNPNVKIYPGHGPNSIIGNEINNIF